MTVEVEAEPAEAPFEVFDSAPAPSSGRGLGRWLALAGLCAVLVGTAFAARRIDMKPWYKVTQLGRALATHVAIVPAAHAAPAEEPKPAKTGWSIKHDGHVPLRGGVLLLPKTFSPDEKGYDLVVHFHGDVKIVLQSMEYAGVNAALAVINHGVRSDAYRVPYTAPGTFEALLKQIEKGLVKRGVEKPKLRKLALTAWSAGYGAIESVLDTRRSVSADHDPLDAIIVLDGVHAGFIDGDNKRLSHRSVATYARAAKAAADGQLMMLLTHSQIDPIDYAGTERTHRYLLKQVNTVVNDSPMLSMPAQVALPAARRAAKKKRRMEPVSDTKVGELHVKGFEGNTRDHHAAHLTQMAPIALVDLAQRWGKVPPYKYESSKPKKRKSDEAEAKVDGAEKAADSASVSESSAAKSKPAGEPDSVYDSLP
jgi:hypothetical protein